MSFVIGAVSLNEVLIASDGRGVHTDGSVADEQLDKTRVINNNVIMGFNGKKSVCENVINFVLNSINPNHKVEDISTIVQKYLKSLSLCEEEKSSFLIGGFNNIGFPELDLLSFDTNFEIQKQTFPVFGYNLFIFSPDGVDGESIVHNRMKSTSNIDEALKLSINDVAKINPTVNNTCYIKRISRT